MIYCASCGNAIEGDAKFCTVCGAPVGIPPYNSAHVPTFHQPEKKKMPVWAIVLIVAGIVVLLGTCCAAGTLIAVNVLDNDEGINIVQESRQRADASMREVPEGEIVPFESLIYKVMNTDESLSQGNWIVIIGGTLPDDIALPVTIEIAVPAGASVFWFGEVGPTGDPAQDPRFAGDFNDMFRTEGDFDIYTATVRYYRDIQIEFRIDDPTTQVNGSIAIELEYTPLHDVSELRLAVAVPVGAEVAETPDWILEFLGYNTHGDSMAYAFLRHNAQAGEAYKATMVFIP